jgi:hypothetical protein
MKKLLMIAVLIVVGIVLYGKFHKEPNVRLEDTLRNRWFSRAANDTGMASAVERFEVDQNMHVKVFLTEDYRGLPGSQMDCLRSIVAIVRNETLKGPTATVDFIYRGGIIAKCDDGSHNVKMLQ